MRRRRATRSIGGWSRGSVVVLALQMLVLGLVSGPIAAGAQEEGMARVSVSRANFRADASMDAEVIATLTEGEEVVVLAQEGSWYRVRHEESGIDGYLHETVIQVLPAPEPIAPPEPQVDEADQARLEAERQRAERDRQEANRRAHEAALAREAQRARQGERRARGDRRMSGFLSVSYGIAVASDDEYTWEYRVPVNQAGGESRGRTTYHLPQDEVFAVGGGVLFGNLGVGVLGSRQTFGDPVDFHEFFSSTGLVPGSPPRGDYEGNATTQPKLERRETAIHIHGVYAPVLGDRFQLKLFIGPTWFEADQETIDFIQGSLNIPARRIEFDFFESSRQSDSSVGGHVGADATFLLAGRFGVGIAVLYSTGEVKLRDRWAEDRTGDPTTRDVDVGGLQAMIGVRLGL